MDEAAALMGRLTRVLASTPREKPLADRLVAALVKILDVDGGSITIGYAASDRTTLCATDALALRIEELQDLLREGPSLDAFRSGALVQAGTDERSSRWPMLAQGLGEEQIDTWLCAVPMRPTAQVLGVVSLHRSGSSGPAVDAEAAQFLANAVGVAILGDFDRSESTDLAWSARDRINQATGMVVAQLRIDPADAVALMRAHAFAHSATVDEVARSLLERRLDFRDADPGSDDDTKDG